MSTTKLSFTVRRPSPLSRQTSAGPDSDRESNFKVPAIPARLTDSGRSTPNSPLANGHKKPQFVPREVDSSDEEDEEVDEMVTGFDQFGVQRSGGKKKKDEGPLIIPVQENRDWREIARKRKAAEMFVPEAGKAAMRTGPDGSVGGLGTKDTINSGPTLVGLVHVEKKERVDADGDVSMSTERDAETTEVTQESEDDRALKALLAEASGEKPSGLAISAIPSDADNDWRAPVDEKDAYRRDVVNRPDSATLEDYARVPVEQFGEALLRGMGWTPGQTGSLFRQGPAQPYVPQKRPALLGLGAKERDLVDDGSSKFGKFKSRPDKRYTPLVKVSRDSEDGRRSGTVSRRSSRSPDSDRRRDRDEDRDRDRDRRKREEREYESERDRDRKRRDYDSDRDRRRDRDGERDSRKDDRDHYRRRERSYDRERSSTKDRERDRR
ncbi:hypothetical protein SCHPADRAFT_998559 [Schizopora paradoxa]|uniref:G-patch domain-containing protein n=1 Tax=Schizopora paradoxa TaxID=27342 RepID=A0A0H2RJ15_9AGAM|nr:hypothetical protein SCHPADRAFT_998559 [Schizopora paradoxa]